GHLHPEASAKTDHRVNNGGGIGGALDAAHETRIDLELVETKPAQVLQAGIAGAEIIQGQPHAQSAQPEHGELCTLGVPEQCALRDLQFKPSGFEIGFGENAFDHVDKVGTAELQCRDVDGDCQVRPSLAVEAGAPQYLFTEGYDQPAVLRN